MRIKEMYIKDRPREKLMKNGASRLSDEELIAVIISTGTAKKSSLGLAREVLRDKKLKELGALDAVGWSKYKGIGKSKACSLAAAFELGLRNQKEDRSFLATSPAAVAEKLKEYAVSKKEHLVGLYLNSRNSLIAQEVISVGTVNESLMHPREVFEPAVRHLATSFLLAHNHPSGDSSPSPDDVEATVRINSLSEMMGIKFLDHLVITPKSFYSFKQNGILVKKPMGGA